VVLDVAMPPPNGIEVCRRIRQVSRVPILMLTVRHGLLDKVRALDLGADDYLTKPFDHLELFARLRALVRRAADAEVAPAPDFHSGDLTVEFATHEVRLRGELLALSPIEQLLLVELVRHAGTTLPHQRLLDRVFCQLQPVDPENPRQHRNQFSGFFAEEPVRQPGNVHG
jgi:DNA-binding response OmpR family regulator